MRRKRPPAAPKYISICPSHPREGAPSAGAASLRRKALGGPGAVRGSTGTRAGCGARQCPRLRGGEERVKDPGLALRSRGLGGEQPGGRARSLAPVLRSPPRTAGDLRRPDAPLAHSLGRRSRTHANTHTPLSLPRALSHPSPRAPSHTRLSLTRALSLPPWPSPPRRTSLAPTCSAAPSARPCAPGPARRSWWGQRAPG